MEFLILLWSNPYVRGAIMGALVAARVDYMAYQAMVNDTTKILAYDWKVAAWRWVIGAAMGVVGADFVT
jgi:hypothetical protein